MSLGKLDNCPRCDTLFVKGIRDVCPKCYQEVEKEYEKCAQFLRKRENRGANIQQVSEATGVSIKQITKFIKEGRISIANNPNMGYPCESCGILITVGNLCDMCAKELKREMSLDAELRERLSEDEKRRSASSKTYRSRTDNE
jgi:flagellar operon protein (TIGR03826 family)